MSEILEKPRAVDPKLLQHFLKEKLAKLTEGIVSEEKIIVCEEKTVDQAEIEENIREDWKQIVEQWRASNKDVGMKEFSKADAYYCVPATRKAGKVYADDAWVSYAFNTGRKMLGNTTARDRHGAVMKDRSIILEQDVQAQELRSPKSESSDIYCWITAGLVSAEAITNLYYQSTQDKTKARRMLVDFLWSDAYRICRAHMVEFVQMSKSLTFQEIFGEQSKDFVARFITTQLWFELFNRCSADIKVVNVQELKGIVQPIVAKLSSDEVRVRGIGPPLGVGVPASNLIHDVYGPIGSVMLPAGQHNHLFLIDAPSKIPDDLSSKDSHKSVLSEIIITATI